MGPSAKNELAIVWELMLLVAIVYLPFLHKPFGTFGLPLVDWAIVVCLAFTVSPVLEVGKWMVRRGWFGDGPEGDGRRNEASEPGAAQVSRGLELHHSTALSVSYLLPLCIDAALRLPSRASGVSLPWGFLIASFWRSRGRPGTYPLGLSIGSSATSMALSGCDVIEPIWAP